MFAIPKNAILTASIVSAVLALAQLAGEAQAGPPRRPVNPPNVPRPRPQPTPPNVRPPSPPPAVPKIPMRDLLPKPPRPNPIPLNPPAPPATPPRPGITPVPGPLGIGNPIEGSGGSGILIPRRNGGIILEGGSDGGGATIILPIGGSRKK